MELLLQVTIVEEGESLVYDVYEFKLNRGVYRAQLHSGKASNEMIFWKENGQWKSRFMKNQRMARIVGEKIDGLKKG